jgi:hypothetical protein
LKKQTACKLEMYFVSMLRQFYCQWNTEIISSNSNRDSFWIIVDRRDASSAACSSNRGMVSFFNGATRDFAATKRISNFPSSNGGMHTSQKHIQMRLRRYIKLAGQYYRVQINLSGRILHSGFSILQRTSSILLVGSVLIRRPSRLPFATIPIFARIRNAIAKPIGS